MIVGAYGGDEGKPAGRWGEPWGRRCAPPSGQWIRDAVCVGGEGSRSWGKALLKARGTGVGPGHWQAGPEGFSCFQPPPRRATSRKLPQHANTRPWLPKFPHGTHTRVVDSFGFTLPPCNAGLGLGLVFSKKIIKFCRFFVTSNL